MIKKTLAIVVPELLPVPPVKGGAVEHWVHEVTHRLDSQQFAITIISRPSGMTLEGVIRYIAIPWTPLEKAFDWMKQRVTWRNPLRYLAKIQHVTSYGLRVAAHVKPFDMVIMHNEPNLLLFIDKKSNQKLILHMHNAHLTHAGLRWLYRRALYKVDMVICVSDYIRLNAIEYFPEHARKFVVLFNATNPDQFKPYTASAIQAVQGLPQLAQEHYHLLYVGRLNAEKGVDVLIKAFGQVLRQHPNGKLVICGSSFFEGAVQTPYQQQLVALAQPIAHAIIFTGFVPHAQLKYLYAAVDIVVLPSVWQDPCPLVVLEAMAAGACLVASRVGGVPEVVSHGEDGLLVNANNPHELAATLNHALDQPAFIKQLGVAARHKIVAHYSWAHLVKQLTQQLHNV
ncbi:MAG TPA: glycosyltransferase family 4 protein [Methylophilus sp.]